MLLRRRNTLTKIPQASVSHKIHVKREAEGEFSRIPDDCKQKVKLSRYRYAGAKGER
jgi:hypothetical protein